MKRYLKFWGTRGSCSVSGPEYARFGGNTPCLELRYDDTFLIFDAGTGIRPLGETIKEKNIDLFLSHTHWDHLIGLPFFAPIYRKDTEITIWAPHGEGRPCHELIKQLLAEEFFPIRLDEVQANLKFKTLEENQSVQIGPITLDVTQTRHPGLTYSFRIKTPKQTIGYVTDNEVNLETQKSFIRFHKNSDLFIHEAQYFAEEYSKKNGWGHSPLPAVIQLIHQIEPKEWLVTHHDPKHTDRDLEKLQASAKKMVTCPVAWIPDGHVVSLA